MHVGALAPVLVLLERIGIKHRLHDSHDIDLFHRRPVRCGHWHSLERSGILHVEQLCFSIVREDNLLRVLPDPRLSVSVCHHQMIAVIVPTPHSSFQPGQAHICAVTVALDVELVNLVWHLQPLPTSKHLLVLPCRLKGLILPNCKCPMRVTKVLPGTLRRRKLQ